MASKEMIVETDENAGYIRTVDDVMDTLVLASVDKADLINYSQVLNRKRDYDDKNIKLLELDKHLEASILEGHTLSFKGQSNESLMLCSNSRTYEVKEAETSNTLLVFPQLKFSAECKTHTNDSWSVNKLVAEGLFHTYLEVRECKPKLGNLLTLLSPSSFNGLEYEKKIDKSTLYDWDRLNRSIQASVGELEKALSQHMVVKMNGYYRLVGLKYEAQALLLMAEFMGANSWELDEINKEETYDALQELIPREVFDLIFHKYTKISDKSKVSNTKSEEPFYAYDEEKVCRIFAQAILIASPNTEYNEFMETWNDATPENIIPKDKYLSGLALIVTNNQTGKKEVTSYPELDLPENIIERFNELFKVQEKWTVEQITPYIAPLATNNTNVSALLTKYARPSMINGVKYYSSKHGK